MFQFTLDHFPSRADVKDRCGLPWGCVLRPFYQHAGESQPSEDVFHQTIDDVDVSDVARCKKCFAYIGPLSRCLHTGWECPLCHTTSDYAPRYATRALRRECPELHHASVEYIVSAEQTKPVAYLALVDISGDEDDIDLIKEGLRAAIQTLPTSCLFGLAVYSTELGIYDLASSHPHVKYFPIPPEGGKSELAIHEIFHHSRIFVPIGEMEEHILEGIACIRPNTPSAPFGDDLLGHSLDASSTSTSNSTSNSSARKRRGYGAALECCVDYLIRLVDLHQEISASRILSFLCGTPNHGIGAFREEDVPETSPNATKRLRQSKYYTSLGTRALCFGVVIDLFIVSSSAVNLCAIHPVANVSGGAIRTYGESARGGTLPQDINRLFRGPMAMRTMLRIRTSKGFAIDSAYGNAYPDNEHEQLYRIGACDGGSAVAFDFVFTHASAFDMRRSQSNAVLQLAFSYIRIPSRKEVELDAINGTSHAQIKRHIRIRTVAIPIARNYGQLYRHMNPEVVLCVIYHKVLMVARSENLMQARELLFDWLIMFLEQYVELRSKAIRSSQAKASSSSSSTGPTRLHTLFSLFPMLRHIASFVFGLLHCKAMDESADADLVAYTQVLYSTLPPCDLRKIIYPDVYLFSSLEELSSHNDCALSLSTVLSSGHSIVLIDGYTSICVYLRASTEESTHGKLISSSETPLVVEKTPMSASIETTTAISSTNPTMSELPSQLNGAEGNDISGEGDGGVGGRGRGALSSIPVGTALRSTCVSLRQRCRVLPSLCVARSGSPEEMEFMSMLVEDGLSVHPHETFEDFLKKCVETMDEMK